MNFDRTPPNLRVDRRSIRELNDRNNIQKLLKNKELEFILRSDLRKQHAELIKKLNSQQQAKIRARAKGRGGIGRRGAAERRNKFVEERGQQRTAPDKEVNVVGEPSDNKKRMEELVVLMNTLNQHNQQPTLDLKAYIDEGFNRQRDQEMDRQDDFALLTKGLEAQADNTDFKLEQIGQILFDNINKRATDNGLPPPLQRQGETFELEDGDISDDIAPLIQEIPVEEQAEPEPDDFRPVQRQEGGVGGGIIDLSDSGEEDEPVAESPVPESPVPEPTIDEKFKQELSDLGLISSSETPSESSAVTPRPPLLEDEGAIRLEKERLALEKIITDIGPTPREGAGEGSGDEDALSVGGSSDDDDTEDKERRRQEQEEIDEKAKRERFVKEQEKRTEEPSQGINLSIFDQQARGLGIFEANQELQKKDLFRDLREIGAGRLKKEKEETRTLDADIIASRKKIDSLKDQIGRERLASGSKKQGLFNREELDISELVSQSSSGSELESQTSAAGGSLRKLFSGMTSGSVTSRSLKNISDSSLTPRDKIETLSNRSTRALMSPKVQKEADEILKKLRSDELAPDKIAVNQSDIFSNPAATGAPTPPASPAPAPLPQVPAPPANKGTRWLPRDERDETYYDNNSTSSESSVEPTESDEPPSEEEEQPEVKPGKFVKAPSSSSEESEDLENLPAAAEPEPLPQVPTPTPDDIKNETNDGKIAQFLFDKYPLLLKDDEWDHPKRGSSHATEGKMGKRLQLRNPNKDRIIKIIGDDKELYERMKDIRDTRQQGQREAKIKKDAAKVKARGGGQVDDL